MYRLSLFDDILRDEESLFVNEQALDYDYAPKDIPFREKQQQHIAEAIKPLFQKKSGRNLFITGSQDIDKTVAVKHVLRELEEKTDDIFIEVVNCSKKGTSELIKVLSKIPNKKESIIVLEDVEQLKEVNLLHTLSKNYSCIFMISNDKDWIANLDNEIKFTLNADILEFKPYSYRETFKILKKRASYAFTPGVIRNKTIKFIAKRAYKNKDVRTGIFLLRESGNIAEMKESKKVKIKHCKKAIEKLDTYSTILKT
jgi:archaeal cell division control protein 6